MRLLVHPHRINRDWVLTLLLLTSLPSNSSTVCTGTKSSGTPGEEARIGQERTGKHGSPPHIIDRDEWKASKQRTELVRGWVAGAARQGTEVTDDLAQDSTGRHGIIQHNARASLKATRSRSIPHPSKEPEADEGLGRGDKARDLV